MMIPAKGWGGGANPFQNAQTRLAQHPVLSRLFPGGLPPTQMPMPFTPPPQAPLPSVFGQGIAQQAQAGAPQMGQSFGQNVVSPQARKRPTPSQR